MSETDRSGLKDTVRRGIEAINEGDAETLRDLVADDVVVHAQGGETARGVDAVVAANVDNTAFPDAELAIEEMIAEGDTVAVRMTFSGTHEGVMHGVEPTGERIEICVISMYRVEDGELAEAWFVEDDADTLSQLGLWGEITG